MQIYLPDLLYTAPELTLPSSYHLNTPIRNMSSAQWLLASFVVKVGRRLMAWKEGRTLPTVRKVPNCKESTYSFVPTLDKVEKVRYSKEVRR